MLAGHGDGCRGKARAHNVVHVAASYFDGECDLAYLRGGGGEGGGGGKVRVSGIAGKGAAKEGGETRQLGDGKARRVGGGGVWGGGRPQQG